MKVIKKDFNSVERTGAHGGSGGRRLFVAEDEIKNFQGMTYGYLPVGNMFAWHNHDGLNEVMFVIKGTGILRAAVHAELKKAKYVKKFRLGVYGEGEDGVTIVEFA